MAEKNKRESAEHCESPDGSRKRMKMCRWWKKKFFLFSAKSILSSFTSCFYYKTREGKGHGLVKLYEDIESCRGYEDIQVMWKMIHSSSPSAAVVDSKKRLSSWRFCFRPNHSRIEWCS